MSTPSDPHQLTDPYGPNIEQASTTGSTEAGVNTVIGPYKLLQKIGEGGFGVVYMAEQAKPVRRMVALKIIKPGMDTAQVIARFESERQALAIMDHPSIAKVHDAGATESGRPYFAMELVKGVPITEYCDKSHLPPEERLKLFIDVCHAIQHAHQKGVIHRDIKPSNVMVTLHDGLPAVKVIDFGVAKATGQKFTDRTLFTEYGQMIGTPTYMSPEQAEMSGLDIDTRSDIYSLGVLLYELLTGTTPLEAKRLREAGYAEMQRIIREEEPPRPSTRLSSMGDTASEFAGNRGTDVKHLSQLLASELDWVVMKALDKDRNRRYATPGGFAEDLERYLRHDAVQACPPSATYRFKKFLRRNRAAALTVGLVLASLVAGVVGTTIGMVRAREAERSAATERDRAEASFRKARAAVDEYFTVVGDNQLLNAPGMQPLRKDLLDRALKYYQGFLEERRDDSSVKAELAATNYRVAFITAIIGSKEVPANHYRQALAIYDELIAAHPAEERYRIDRAIVLNDLGNLLEALGRKEECVNAHRQALEIRTVLAQAHPNEGRYQNELAKSQSNLGRMLIDRGDAKEALDYLERARAINERWARAPVANLASFPTDLGRNFNKPQDVLLDLALDLGNIGYAHYRQGRNQEATSAYEKSREVHEELVRDHPNDASFRKGLAHMLTRIAFVHGISGRHEEAMRANERALEIASRLATENPSVREFQVQSASVHREMGRNFRRKGQFPQAREHLVKSRQMMEKVVQDEPTSVDFALSLAYSYRELGWIDRAQDRPSDAIGWFQKARAIDERHAPNSIGVCYDLACDCAVCIPLVGWKKAPAQLSDSERAERQRMGDEAMKALRRAVDGGWRNHQHMTKDEDLDALRDRDDFKKLLAELASEQKPAEKQSGVGPSR